MRRTSNTDLEVWDAPHPISGDRDRMKSAAAERYPNLSIRCH